MLKNKKKNFDVVVVKVNENKQYSKKTVDEIIQGD